MKKKIVISKFLLLFFIYCESNKNIRKTEETEDLIFNKDGVELRAYRLRHGRATKKNICMRKDIDNNVDGFRDFTIECNEERVDSKVFYTQGGQKKFITYTYWPNGFYKTIEFYKDDGLTIKSVVCFSSEKNRYQIDCPESFYGK